jgi:copper transport protein
MKSVPEALSVFVRVFVLLVAFLWVSVPGAAAHSTLLRASPAPDGRLAEPPDQVVLTFNERLENRLYRINVYDEKGLPVADRPAEMDRNRKIVRLALPKLPDGSYTVSYRIVSADGHPVQASYVFTVGSRTEAKIGYTSASKLHEEHELGKNVPYWLIRIFYYASLLAVTGWAGIRVLVRGIGDDSPARFRFVFRLLLGLHAAALALIAWKDLLRLGTGFGKAEQVSLLLGTSIGLSYLLAFSAVAAGFAVAGKRRLPDAVWIAFMFAAKGLNGHAMGYAVPAATFALDVLHLFAASVWTGVLLAVALHWRKRERERILPHLPALSQAALAAVALLTVSGLAAAYLYSDGFRHLTLTWWGKLLLAKSAAVLLVVAAGYGLRRRVRAQRWSGFGGWLSLDIGLHALIVSIAGIFTFLNPLAATGPLFWHENVNGVHIAAIVTPNEPGAVNQFNVSVGGTGRDGGLKRVTLKLAYLDNPDIAPIEVPLSQVETNGSPLRLYDHHYSAEGKYLAFAGKWRLEVSVLDRSDNEYVTTKVFYNERR